MSGFVFIVKDEDIDCCHDTLRKELVNEFIQGGYKYIEVNDDIFEVEILVTKDETIVFLGETVLID